MKIFKPADIMLPSCDMHRWSVVACDQFTSEPVLNGVLGSAYRAVRTLGPVIGLKIEHAHYAAAHRTVF